MAGKLVLSSGSSAGAPSQGLSFLPACLLHMAKQSFSQNNSWILTYLGNILRANIPKDKSLCAIIYQASACTSFAHVSWTGHNAQS